MPGSRLHWTKLGAGTVKNVVIKKLTEALTRIGVGERWSEKANYFLYELGKWPLPEKVQHNRF